MHRAKEHAQKIAEELLKLVPAADRSKRHAIFVQAAPVMFRHDTDRELPYHQEANFSYLTGCNVPASSVLITLPKCQHQLFIPAADPLETMWSVAPPTLEEARSTLQSDAISYTSDLPKSLDALAGSGEVIIHTFPETMEYPALPSSLKDLSKGKDDKIRLCTDYLVDACQIARLIKDEEEIELIRKANRISCAAHEVLMKALGKHAKSRAGSKGKDSSRTGKESAAEWEVESEGDAEALFVASCKRAGASQAYLPIVASGSHASTLHYVCNDRLFPSTATPRQNGDTSFNPRNLGRGCCGGVSEHDHSTPTSSFHSSAFEPQVLLIDAGCEWKDYASDITRTMPIGNGGKFTEKAAEIYDLVLKMQKDCEEITKAGTHWDAIHLHAHKILIDGFIKLGIFTGSPDEILQSGVSAAFFPHGLGHSMGLDVHDSRQYLKAVHLDLPKESANVPKLYTYLRLRQVLHDGMVVTIEPGCYFAPQLMEEHGVWTSKYVNKDKLREYLGVGGVRLEDDVVVRQNGCENLTIVPRERAEVESWCSGGQ